MSRRDLGLPHALAASLCAGLGGATLLRPSLVAAAALGCVLVAVVAAAPDARVPAAACAAALLLGWAWGGARLAALDHSDLVAQAGKAGPAVVVVTGPARRGSFALRVPARAEAFRRAAVDEPVLLELPLGRAPPQGARLELIAAVALPRTAERGGFDERRWLRLRGAHVVVKARRFAVVGRRGGIPGLGDRLRAHVARGMAPGVEGERRAVIAGVVLGEDEGLPPDLADGFRASGLYHLLAVSGQNVAYIAAGVFLLAWLLALPRRVTELLVLAAIVGYVLAVGWQPSVVRAGVAGCLVSLAWLAARPRDRWHFMLVGAAVLLAWNPYSLLEPGFQLSFAAVAAIFLAVPRFERVLEGYPVPGRLAAVLAISTACGLATAPILWLHFEAVPVYSVPANALAAPVVGPLLGLGLAAAAAEPLLPGAALALAWLNGWLAAYLAWCARAVGGLPHAQATTTGALLLLAIAAGAVVLLVRARGRQRRHVALLLALVSLVTVGWRLVPSTPPPPAGLRLTLLDVGQGDGILLQVREGAVLVDQGPPEARIADQLRRMGVRRLSLLVLTHPQRDHIGGAADVVRKLRVEQILDPALDAPSPERDETLAAARERGVPVAVARAGAAYRIGRLTLRVLWPRDAGPPGIDPNERSIVALASYGEVDVLLTADAESHVTAPLRPPPVEILKVAHHGSADPRLPDLLATTRPLLALVSAGRGNSYGHPTPSTLAALESVRGLRVHRTDREGRVTIESDGRRLHVLRER